MSDQRWLLLSQAVVGAIGTSLQPQNWWLLPVLAGNQRDVPEPAPALQPSLFGDRRLCTARCDGERGGWQHPKQREGVRATSSAVPEQTPGLGKHRL